MKWFRMVFKQKKRGKYLPIAFQLPVVEGGPMGIRCPRTHTHTRTHARAHTRIHTRAHTRTLPRAGMACGFHTRVRGPCSPGVSRRQVASPGSWSDPCRRDRPSSGCRERCSRALRGVEAELKPHVYSGDKGRAGELPIHLSLKPQAFPGLSSPVSVTSLCKEAPGVTQGQGRAARG